MRRFRYIMIMIWATALMAPALRAQRSRTGSSGTPYGSSPYGSSVGGNSRYGGNVSGGAYGGSSRYGGSAYGNSTYGGSAYGNSMSGSSSRGSRSSGSSRSSRSSGSSRSSRSSRNRDSGAETNRANLLSDSNRPGSGAPSSGGGAGSSAAGAGKTTTRLTRKSTGARPSGSGSTGPMFTGRFEDKANINLCVLSLSPANVSTRQGESFITTLSLSNPALLVGDRMTLALEYDPNIVAPESVDLKGLAAYCLTPPRVLVNRGSGVIHADMALKKSFIQSYRNLMSIQWNALQNSFASQIEFGEGTGFWRGAENVLGDPQVDGDGVINTHVAVLQSFDRDEELEPEFLLDPETVVGPEQKVARLTLYGPGQSIPVGQDFYVDVWLDNPRRMYVDDVRFHIAFDRERLEVVDEDTDNYVTRGINILDGPFHDEFPFDKIEMNEAFNQLGEIYYGVGMVSLRRLPEKGAFARIRFRAKKGGIAQVRFVQGDTRDRYATRVSYLGQNLLRGGTDNPDEGLTGCALQIRG